MKTLFATIAVLLLCGAAYSQGGNKVLWVQNFPGNVNDCAFMPDEDYIIHTLEGALQIRRTVDQSLVIEKKFEGAYIANLDVSRDKKYLAVSGTNILALLDINTLEIYKEFDIPDHAWDDTTHRIAKEVSISADASKIAYLSFSSVIGKGGLRYVNVLDVASGKTIFKFGDTANTTFRDVGTGKFSPDGKWLACAYDNYDSDPHIYLFDTDSFKLQHIFWNKDGLESRCMVNFNFSADSKLISSRCDGLEIKFVIWDIETEKRIVEERDIYAAGNVAFFKEGNIIFLSDENKTMYFYDIELKKVVYDFGFNAPVSADPVLNSDETKLLSHGSLIQIDRTVVSVPIENTKKNKSGIIIPNPATGDITVKLELPYSDVLKLEIFDEMGKNFGVIHNSMAAQGNFELRHNILYLPVSAYFMRVSQKDYSETIKFVKE